MADMVGLAQLVSASGCGPEGRGFESHISPQKKSTVHRTVLFFCDELRDSEPHKFPPKRKFVVHTPKNILDKGAFCAYAGF